MNDRSSKCQQINAKILDHHAAIIHESSSCSLCATRSYAFGSCFSPIADALYRQVGLISYRQKVSVIRFQFFGIGLLVRGKKTKVKALVPNIYRFISISSIREIMLGDSFTGTDWARLASFPYTSSTLMTITAEGGFTSTKAL